MRVRRSGCGERDHVWMAPSVTGRIRKAQSHISFPHIHNPIECDPFLKFQLELKDEMGSLIRLLATHTITGHRGMNEC